MAAGVRGAVAGELSQEERLRQRCERAGVSMHMLVLLLLPVVSRCLLHDEYFDCAHVSQDVVDKRLNQHDAVIISPSSRVFISQSIQTSFPAIFFSNSSSRLCILNA
jgi:hypothetical protein